MKQYQTPELLIVSCRNTDSLASLSQWLTDNSLTGAGITTYLVNS